jgi:Fur family ferric uptake transcriptional regulator
MGTGLQNRAETLVRRHAERVTRSRVAVLAVLLAAPRALTHHEVHRSLGRARRVDRVTLYRVLDWLVARGLAHKISGDDRVWRFNAAEDEPARRHAHFECNDCGKVICLEKVPVARSIPLPSGYRPQAVELTVKGLCGDCRRH